MEQRYAARPRSGWLATVQTAILADALLGSQALGALAGLACGGFVAGTALALLVGGERAGAAWGLALLAGVALGLVLVALTVHDRRHFQRLRRGQWRFFGALGVLCLGMVVAAVTLTPWPLWVAGGGSIVAAIATLFAAQRARRAAEGATWELARGRRAAWQATLRASRLTRRMLGYPAYRQLRRDGFLPVRSTIHPNRTYQVPLRTTPSGARILVLEHDRPIGGLCLRPREPLPDPEEALTHILAIRTDERAWLNRANFFPQDRELTPQALGLAAGRPGNYDR
jgi:hypothetical protein